MLPRHPLVRGVLVVSVLIIAVGLALRTLADAGYLLGAILVPVALSVLFTGLLMPLQVLLNHKLKLPRAVGAGLTIVASVVLTLPELSTNLARYVPVSSGTVASVAVPASFGPSSTEPAQVTPEVAGDQRIET